MAANLRCVDDYLKCTFCRVMFTGEVKLVPNCGNSICDDCSRELTDELDGYSGQFKCKACGEIHEMPRGGFPNNQALMLILKATPVKKPLSEKARTLETLVEEIQEKTRQLETFNGKEKIDVYCNELLIDVEQAVQSGIEHLQDIGQDLVTRIENHRAKLSAGLVLGNNNGHSITSSRNSNAELEKLAMESKNFIQVWNDYFSSFDAIKADVEIEAAQRQAQACLSRLERLESSLTEELFDKSWMVFDMNHSFCRNKDILGKLLIQSSKPNSTVVNYTIEEKPIFKLTGHSGPVFQTVFLSNGNLASCSREIKIWNVEDGRLLFELRGHDSIVNCLSALPNGWLASGSMDKTIKLWDLDKRKEVRTLTGHTSRVISLKTLTRERLASYSFDDTIKIWNPYSVGGNLLISIAGHGNTNCFILMLGVLSNDDLVTCSYDTGVVRVWNSSRGLMVNSYMTSSREAKSLCVLKNDSIAVGFICGLIKIINLTEDDKHLKIEKTHAEFITMSQLENGNLLTSGKDAGNLTIKMWNSTDATLVQSFNTCHNSYILSIEISHSHQLVATASDDCTVKIWKLNK